MKKQKYPQLYLRLVDPEASSDQAEIDRLDEALTAAAAPGTLDPLRNEQLIAAALDQLDAPLAPPTAEELSAAEELRRALEDQRPRPETELVEALQNAFNPGDVALSRLEAMVSEATFATHAQIRTQRSLRRVFWGSGALAAAAAVSFWVVIDHRDTRGPERASAAATDLPALSRSTAPLFTERFDATTTTERIDRIAWARERDLRHNQYLAWRVR